MSKNTKEVTTMENRQDLRYVTPAVDIRESTEEYVLVAEIPGAGKEDVTIDLDKDELKIEARAEVRGNGDAVYTEFEPVVYLRKFRVGNDIERDTIKATIKNGMLVLNLPKAPEARPRTISIES